MLRDNIEFTFNPEAQPSRIKADPGQIREVMMNLVMNARDAMPNGGKLQLRTGNAYLKNSSPISRPGSSRETMSPLPWRTREPEWMT